MGFELIIINYDAQAKTATVSGEYQQDGPVPVLQHDITLDIPDNLTLMNVAEVDNKLNLTVMDTSNQKQFNLIQDSGLPADLLGDNIQQFTESKVNAKVCFQQAQQTQQAASQQAVAQQDAAQQDAAQQVASQQAAAQQDAQNQQQRDQNVDPLIVDLLEARKEYCQAIEDLSPKQYTADGYRVQDVMRGIDRYLIFSLSLFGTEKTHKKEMLDCYQTLNHMMKPGSAKSSSLAIAKKSRGFGAKRTVLSAVLLIGAVALAGLAVALILSANPILMFLLVPTVPAFIVCTVYGIKAAVKAHKPLQFGRETNRLLGYASNPDANKEPNRSALRQNRLDAKNPERAFNELVSQEDFKSKLSSSGSFFDKIPLPPGSKGLVNSLASAASNGSMKKR